MPAQDPYIAALAVVVVLALARGPCHCVDEEEEYDVRRSPRP